MAVRRTWKAEHHLDWGLLATLALIGSAALMVVAPGVVFRFKEVTPAIALVPVFLLITLPIANRAGREERQFDLANLMLLSMALSFIAAYFRFLNAVDASVYHAVGRDLADSFRSFNFTPALGRGFIGTGSLRYLTGLVEVVTFKHEFATFLVFAFISFWGRYLLYRAFVIGFPEGDRYRYAKLVLLWPSMIFWPSSSGTEAVMITFLGVASLGAARLFTHQRGGLTVLALGLVGCGLVRPHVGLLLVAAVLVAYVFRRETHGSTLRIAAKVVGIIVLIVAAGLAAIQTTEFLELENLGSGSVDQAFEETQAQTAQGGSGFAAARVRTPVDYPVAAVTVLLRPLPFEAHNAESLATGLESTVLLFLIATAIPRLRRLPGILRQHAYVVFASAFTAVFIYAFSVVGNFGILARQRTQVLPFVFVLLSLPAAVTRPGKRRYSRRSRRLQAELDAASGEVESASDPTEPADVRP
jgi:hypothetical protein